MSTGTPRSSPRRCAMSSASDVELQGVVKRFDDAVAVDGISARDPVRLVLRAARPVRLRQDDDAADDRRLRGAGRGRDPARRPGRRRPAAVQARRQHRLPELRALPAPDRLRERRVRPAPEGRRRRAGEGPRSREMLRARRPDGSRRTASRASSPAASSSASRSRARSSTGRRCCCSTSRSARST